MPCVQSDRLIYAHDVERIGVLVYVHPVEKPRVVLISPVHLKLAASISQVDAYSTP